MNKTPECALYYSLHTIAVRMIPDCEEPTVQLGSQTCQHFQGEPRQEFESPKDITDQCRRAKEARKSGPIERYLPKTINEVDPITKGES